jgi:perosamine synthetase
MIGDFIPYGRQSISPIDEAAVLAALKSEYLTTGPRVSEFEEKFARAVGAKHAVAVVNATAALHLAMRVCGVGSQDRVVTSPITFLASANAAAFVGATPDFCDIEPITRTLESDDLLRQWKPNTKAVISVAYAGQSADLEQIGQITRSRGARLIDDASHAVGTNFYAGGKTWSVGSNPWADVTVFSFHPVKTMTTAEGGMLVTNDESLAESARRLRSHGVSRQNFEGLGDDLSQELREQGPWYYEMTELGYNYRLPDVLCALGSSQLDRLDVFIARRREIVARYNSAFANLPFLKRPQIRSRDANLRVSWHLYAVEIDFPGIHKSRREVMEEFRRCGIGTQVHYIPVYLQPWYRRTYGYGPGKCPIAEAFYQRTLSLPLFSDLTDHDVERVINATQQIVTPR